MVHGVDSLGIDSLYLRVVFDNDMKVEKDSIIEQKMEMTVVLK